VLLDKNPKLSLWVFFQPGLCLLPIPLEWLISYVWQMSYWAIFLAYSITTLLLHASFFALQAIH
jgi:hypothetical protein